MNAETDIEKLVWSLIIVIALYHAVAFARFQVVHPKANEMTFWTYYKQVVSFQEVSELK